MADSFYHLQKSLFGQRVGSQQPRRAQRQPQLVGQGQQAVGVVLQPRPQRRAGIGIGQNAGKYIPPLFIGSTALAAGQQPVLVDAGTHPAGLQVGGGVNAVLGQQSFQRRAGDGLGIQQVSPQ